MHSKKYLPLLFAIAIFLFSTGLAIDFYKEHGVFSAVSAIGYLIVIALLFVRFASWSMQLWAERVCIVTLVILTFHSIFTTGLHWATASASDRRFLIFGIVVCLIFVPFAIRKEITGHGPFHGWRRKNE